MDSEASNKGTSVLEVSPVNTGESVEMIKAMLLPFGLVGEPELDTDRCVVRAVIDSICAKSLSESGLQDYHCREVGHPNNVDNPALEPIKPDSEVPPSDEEDDKSATIRTSDLSNIAPTRKRTPIEPSLSAKRLTETDPFCVLINPNVMCPLLLAYYIVLLFLTIFF